MLPEKYEMGFGAGHDFAVAFFTVYVIKEDEQLDGAAFVKNCEALFNFNRFADYNFRDGFRDGIRDFAAGTFKD